ncbi:hypothetical protein LSH36_476g00006 [Paralvinella palmiformis]|uniref:Serine palmitoyltransferase 1 n=1 Tax=Paralvinella palmiformis TaxID=53620 RepID=A0AAD9J9A8_9ANNE|nr:hypothetical protein LSH36_476g00006 [Paralvinella palmiformis]
MAGVSADPVDASVTSREAAWDLYEMIQACLQAPSYHLLFEAVLIVWIIQLLFVKSYKAKATLTEKEKEELIEDWRPEPLVPEVDPEHPVLQDMENRLIDGKIGRHVNINGKTYLNVASMNFLGMSGRVDIEASISTEYSQAEVAIDTVKKYGVGSCGPRGFYGTVDVHLELEDKLAEFMGVEEVIMYSYGLATISSAIPAYSKRGDIIFCDEGVNFSIQKGLVASRSKIYFFKHNDLEDLEGLLKAQEREDKQNPKKAKVTRRFLVVEGLYMKYGDFCPLPKLVELKWKYKVRIFLDETLSFGTLGATGRGITEHYGISIDNIDLMAASLEHAFGSYGGFCCGRSYVVDHQRLSGLGYCFSASTPPMLTTAAIKALSILQENPELLTKLHDNIRYIYEKLSKINGLRVMGETVSPMLFLQLAGPSDNRELDKAILRKIVQKAEEQGVVLILAAYLEEEEHTLPPPSIRISVSAELTHNDIDRVVSVIDDCYQNTVS